MVGTLIKKLAKYDATLKVKKAGPTITVSGLSGSGKSTVAETMAKTLRFKMVSVGDIFRQLAKEKKMKLEEFAKTAGPEVDYEIDRRSIKLAKEGKVVLVGRLAGYAAGSHADWKVFVECPLHIRAQRVSKRDKKTVARAKKDIQKRDSGDSRRYKRLYNIDDRSRKIYDVTINTGYITKDELVKISAQIAKFLVRH